MRSQVGGPPEDWNLRAPLLDGWPLEDCVVADEEEGWAEVYQRGEGRIRRIDLPKLRLEGKVELIGIKEWSQQLKEKGSWQECHTKREQ